MTESFVTLFGLKILTRHISKAFYWTHSVDPNAKVYINDYNIELINDKSDAFYGLVSELLKDGIPIHAVGFQSHFMAKYHKI